jgi:hypothetical protein
MNCNFGGDEAGVAFLGGFLDARVYELGILSRDFCLKRERERERERGPKVPGNLRKKNCPEN